LRSLQKIESFSLITAFVITQQEFLNATTDDNLFAVSVYVAYRKRFPDKDTVNIVKKALKDHNIDYSQLADLSATNCTLADSLREVGRSA